MLFLFIFEAHTWRVDNLFITQFASPSFNLDSDYLPLLIVQEKVE